MARCTVERLMRVLGLEGARRGRTVRTTRSDPGAGRPADLAKRNWNPARPNALWVADFAYVATWAGFVYVAFVLDAFSRRIVGWKAATTMRTELVLNALEIAIWTRRRAGITDLSGLVAHTDAGSQPSTCRCGTPNGSPKPTQHRRSARSATPMTTLWPRARSDCSRPR